MGKVVGFRVDWRRPAGRRGAVFEELHARPGFRRRTQARYLDDGAERPVEAFLGWTAIEALVSDAHPEQLFVEGFATFRIGDADRRMVDAEKQLVAVSGPNPSTLAGREIEKFQRMAVGIAELESSHETVCWWQRHRPGIGDRREADPLEFGVGLV